MAKAKQSLRICTKGHRFYKSSDCLTCPVCEQRKPKEGFLSVLPAPARRALENQGITSLSQLSGFNEGEILKLHGIGPSSLPKLKAALAAQGLRFRKS